MSHIRKKTDSPGRQTWLLAACRNQPEWSWARHPSTPNLLRSESSQEPRSPGTIQALEFFHQLPGPHPALPYSLDTIPLQAASPQEHRPSPSTPPHPLTAAPPVLITPNSVSWHRGPGMAESSRMVLPIVASQYVFIGL